MWGGDLFSSALLLVSFELILALAGKKWLAADKLEQAPCTWEAPKAELICQCASTDKDQKGEQPGHCRGDTAKRLFMRTRRGSLLSR